MLVWNELTGTEIEWYSHFAKHMKRILLVVGLAIGASALAVAVIIPQVRSANILATQSAAASLYQALENSEQGNELADEWQVLINAEYNSLVLALTNAGASLDACPHCNTPDGIFGDAWGRRFQVAARKNDERQEEFMIWSKGPDGHSGTDDDIIVPENKSAEIRNLAKVAADKKGRAP